MYVGHLSAFVITAAAASHAEILHLALEQKIGTQKFRLNQSLSLRIQDHCQGDQIGRMLAYWAVVYFWRVFKL
jgi:hypothetical protein